MVNTCVRFRLLILNSLVDTNLYPLRSHCWAIYFSKRPVRAQSFKINGVKLFEMVRVKTKFSEVDDWRGKNK